MSDDLYEAYLKMFQHGVNESITADDLYSLKLMELINMNIDKLSKEEVDIHAAELKRAYEFYKNK